MKILIAGLDYAEPDILFGEEKLDNLRRLMDYGCFGRLVGERVSNKNAAWLSLLTSQNTNQLAPSPENFSLHHIVQDDYVGQYIWSPMMDQGKKVKIFVSKEESQGRVDKLRTSIYSANQILFQRVKESLLDGEWDFLMFVDQGIEDIQTAAHLEYIEQDEVQEYYIHLDEQIGFLLELLDNETLVLVVSPFSSFFQEKSEGCFILASSNNPLIGEIYDIDLVEIAPTVLELGDYDIPVTMKGVSLVASKAMDSLNSGDISAEEEEILRERLSGLGYIE